MRMFSKLLKLKPKGLLKPKDSEPNKTSQLDENGLHGRTEAAQDSLKNEARLSDSNSFINSDQCGDHAELKLLAGEKIDFDLFNLEEDSTHYSELDALAFNPLKSFSQPVDIDLNRLQHLGFVTPQNVNTLLGNTFRMVKRPLLNNVMGKGATVLDNANLIMVTSSLSGEGKTFSAINLAMSIAMERDNEVLLIDADINKPSHHDVFGFKAEMGLTDYLRGKVTDMSRVLYKSNIPSLTLMPAGTKTAHGTELLASEAMHLFVDEISKKYKNRIIIFDSPPLLLPTEASVLASHMGQVVVVVQAEKTRQGDIKKSLSMLSNKIVLLLLNQAYDKTQIGNYGYYKYDD
tara:strand:+ start:7569 stop:8609 length:1041 start_codon:yes stop_codon:yes gene_type:complete